MDELTLRQADKKDIPQLSKLLVQLFSIEQDFSANEEIHAKGLEQLIDSHGIIFCAEKNQQILGMVTVQTLISTAQGGPSAVLEDVIVDQKHRGSGIGISLLNQAKQYCQEKGYVRMQLVADKSNHPAHDFYSKQGWERTNLDAWWIHL